jgi:hypothetical protein
MSGPLAGGAQGFPAAGCEEAGKSLSGRPVHLSIWSLYHASTCFVIE